MASNDPTITPYDRHARTVTILTTVFTSVIFVHVGRRLWNKKEPRVELQKAPKHVAMFLKVGEYLDEERRPYKSCYRYMKENHILLNVFFGNPAIRKRKYRFVILLAHSMCLLSMSLHLRIVETDPQTGENVANEKGAFNGLIIILSAIALAFSFTRFLKYAQRSNKESTASKWLIGYCTLLFFISAGISEKHGGDFEKTPGPFLAAEIAEWAGEFWELLFFYYVAGCCYARLPEGAKMSQELMEQPQAGVDTATLEAGTSRKDTFTVEPMSPEELARKGTFTVEAMAPEELTRQHTASLAAE